jgi:hypothetical protein
MIVFFTGFNEHAGRVPVSGIGWKVQNALDFIPVCALSVSRYFQESYGKRKIESYQER